MKKGYWFLFFFFCMLHAKSQNLVPNPSFETYTTCPTGASQISLAIPWQGVTTNSTEYFNACAISGSGVSIPNGGGGAFQYARTGVAYGGLWAINSYGGNYREYLQVQLDSTLELDSCYYVEFYCNLNNLSYYSINKMGAYLSNMAVSAVGPSTWGLVLQYTPQIVSDTFLTDTLNWMRISGYYQASGGEKYITIGNFDADVPSDTLQMPAGTYPGAYYYIDDVTVKKVVGCDTTLTVNEINNTSKINIFPNPANDKLSIQLENFENSIITIYNMLGEIVSTSKMVRNTTDIDISLLNNGVYIVSINTEKGVLRQKIIKNAE